ncbi:MAG: METTL5 family protein [archaeon]|nr:METTL5 family protein [Nanoarchaeota archaeon]
MSFRSKKELEITLSKLEGFKEALVGLEQYATPEHIAADWIWWMAMNKEVANKNILDAASGPGILGIGLLLLGAKKVYFVDKDPEIMQICIKNYNKIKEEYDLGEAEFMTQDISIFDQEVDIVVQNPPFGTKEKHIDKLFLEKAFQVAPVIYSMHKSNTKEFVEAISKDHNFKITHHWRYEFPIKATFHFHKKPVKDVEVGLWRMEKV